MTIQIIDCEQNSPEWLAARRGIITASELCNVMRTEGVKKGSPSVTRRKYMLRLAADRLGAEPAEMYTNGHMERGKALEDEARRLYAFAMGEEPVRVGFIKNIELNCGCSPDSLIQGGRAGLEIKTKLPDIQLEVLLAGEMPNEHIPQVQGVACFGELDYVDFVSYWPGLPPFIKKVPRDESYIHDIAEAVARFNDELAAVVELMRHYGQAEAEAA